MSSYGKKFGGGSSGGNKKSGLRIFWIPTSHKSHKHKKNKYYVQDKNDSPRTAMMSGDSPNQESFFDFKEGRTTPPPTTSKDIGIQSTSSGIGVKPHEIKPEVIAASAVLVDPPKEHGPGTNYLGALDGNENKNKDDAITTDEKKPFKNDERPDDQRNKESLNKTLNGKSDQLDGNWVSPSDTYKQDEQDDGCAVKCLYYTMQCCECTVL